MLVPGGGAAGPVAPPAGVSEEDIADPENANLMRSVQYCEIRLNEINQEIQNCIKAETRIPKRTKALMKIVATSKAQIVAGINQGAIS